MAVEQTDIASGDDDDEGIDLLDLALPLAEHWKLLVLGPVVAGLLALGIAFLIPKTYTSRTVFLPPQQQQSAAASAIAQLGALSGLVGSAAGLKSPADQYVALLQSTTVADRLIDEFKLMQVYDKEFRFKAREELAKNVRVSLGKKDGLISIDTCAPGYFRSAHEAASRSSCSSCPSSSSVKARARKVAFASDGMTL